MNYGDHNFIEITQHVELVVSSVSSRAVRQAQHSLYDTCMGSTRRTCRVETWRAKWNLGIMCHKQWPISLLWQRRKSMEQPKFDAIANPKPLHQSSPKSAGMIMSGTLSGMRNYIVLPSRVSALYIQFLRPKTALTCGCPPIGINDP